MEEVKHVASFDENGKVVLKSKEKIRKGRLSRAQGARFEAKVRKNLEDQAWILDKWTNNVDLENSKLIPAKRKFNPFMKVMSIGTGFPDYVAIKHVDKNRYEVIGIEVKMKGLLDREEKLKAKWYLDNKIFSQILIAKKGEKLGDIEYVDFSERWGEKVN